MYISLLITSASWKRRPDGTCREITHKSAKFITKNEAHHSRIKLKKYCLNKLRTTLFRLRSKWATLPHYLVLAVQSPMICRQERTLKKNIEYFNFTVLSYTSEWASKFYSWVMVTWVKEMSPARLDVSMNMTSVDFETTYQDEVLVVTAATRPSELISVSASIENDKPLQILFPYRSHSLKVFC